MALGCRLDVPRTDQSPESVLENFTELSRKCIRGIDSRRRVLLVRLPRALAGPRLPPFARARGTTPPTAHRPRPPAAQTAQIAIMREAQTKASTPSTESIQSGAPMGMPVIRGSGGSQARKGVSPECRTGRRSAALSSCSDTSCSGCNGLQTTAIRPTALSRTPTRAPRRAELLRHVRPPGTGALYRRKV
jgi:hypothetical protein